MADNSIALKTHVENMEKERQMLAVRLEITRDPVSNTIQLSNLAGYLALVLFPLNHENKR
ncbi:hypothetical protein X801_05379 [Opisthorchis viverrini]|uniref:Uncharacterized protein n=2 Tax=Opisthorchis viverrini TaxID=6198 RepID=A0A1S8WX09_OPIVI